MFLLVAKAAHLAEMSHCSFSTWAYQLLERVKGRGRKSRHHNTQEFLFLKIDSAHVVQSLHGYSKSIPCNILPLVVHIKWHSEQMKCMYT